jgi:hypothetical protein
VSRITCQVIRGLWIHLLRYQQPLVRLGQARRHRAVGLLLLPLRLLHLMRIEVERILLGQDRLPRQELPQCLVEVLQAHLVGREEDQCVAVEAWCVAARFEDRPRRRLGRVAGFPAVGIVDR